jgi:uncharacterized lipoprotein YajG
MTITRKSLLLTIVLLLISAVILSGCKAKDPLLGKWQEPVSGISMEFTKDGKLLMGSKGTIFTMTYIKQDPNIVVIKASTDGSIPDQSMTYRVETDKLILSVDGIDTIFTRMK